MFLPFKMLFPLVLALFSTSALAFSNTTQLPANLPELLQNEDIRNTWHTSFLETCLHPPEPPSDPSLRCFVRQIGLERVRVEVLSRGPAILRIPHFLADGQLSAIERKVRTSSEVESQGVEGLAYSEGYRGRQADGLWMRHGEPEVRALYKRIQALTALNPAIAEDFLVLKYAPFGHYAPHYDHLEAMEPSYDDGWFAYFGNRLATALLLVKTAQRGGSTVFPNLGLNIVPQRGDLLLWLNADSNDAKEQDSLHAACPIVQGEKIAVSLWIRGNFQDGLKCSTTHAGYEPEALVRTGLRREEEGPAQRPSIPLWVLRQ